MQNAACGRNQNRWSRIFRQRISRGAEKATGNPLLERRRSAHGDNELKVCAVLINDEVSPALAGPTPSGPAPPARTFIWLAVGTACR